MNKKHLNSDFNSMGNSITWIPSVLVPEAPHRCSIQWEDPNKPAPTHSVFPPVFYITLNLSGNPLGLLSWVQQSPHSLVWNNRKSGTAVSESRLRLTSASAAALQQLISFKIPQNNMSGGRVRSAGIDRLIVLCMAVSDKLQVSRPKKQRR